ncbi:MAG: hypothetical protein R3323_02605 [Wenzhouxiangellaceae bacterium]|nr:hypothetical protein [Wenzhouxiangellaceae bacterium]
MNIWTAIVAMAAIWGVVQVSRSWMDGRQRSKDREEFVPRDQVEELESRIRTLERIVTDDRESLRRKIDDL